MHSSVSITTLLWVASHFVRKHLDPNAVVHSYRPFEVNSWARYTCSVFLEVFAVFWTGYGLVALDCLVATYYAQAEVQLKIIKYNLEHLFDSDDLTASAADGHHRYRDVYDTDVKKRFVHYVQRYEKLAWYTQEISTAFNYSMSFQFFTAIVTICATTFRMSVTPMLSVPFVFLFVYLLIILTEVFLYCYFGNLVHYESRSVVTALYLSNWQSASPKFRRVLLIAMSCWSKTLVPTVSDIVPLSLDTFVTILKSAYSLYAVNCSLVGSKQQ